MARIVPSLQLAKTLNHSYTLHLTSYTLHLTGRSRIFLHRAFFARHYSLPPRQPSVFARLARWQLVSYAAGLCLHRPHGGYEKDYVKESQDYWKDLFNLTKRTSSLESV